MKIISDKTLFSIICFCLLPALVSADGEWNSEKNKDDIAVFSRSVPGSGLREFKAVSDVAAKAADAVNVIEDVDHYTDWFPGIKEIKIIKKIGSAESIVYELEDVPFPMNNRDCVFDITSAYDSDTKITTLRINALPDYIQPKKGIVRMKNVAAFWRFVPDDANGIVTVSYQIYAEPGGNVPAWAANKSMSKRVFAVFTKLREQLKGPKYSDAAK